MDQPPCYVVRVRYGMCDAEAKNVNSSLMSGDIVKWDTNSADGVTISACTAITDAVAGVLITPALTQDSGTFDKDDNLAWMAVGGYVMASIDTSECTAGYVLCLSEQIAVNTGRGLGTWNNSTTAVQSKDIGTLLSDPGADGIAPVWLNCF